MLHLVIIFDLRDADVAAFERYEDTVLPLLGEHQGLLISRIRTNDQLSEIHVVRFPSADEYDSYRADPRRIAAAPLLAASGVKLSVVPVEFGISSLESDSCP